MIALRFGIGCSQFRLELRTTLFVFLYRRAMDGFWVVANICGFFLVRKFFL